MTALNSPLSVLTMALIRGICLAIATLFISLGLSIPVQAQEKPEVKYAQVGDVKLAYYLKAKGTQ